MTILERLQRLLVRDYQLDVATLTPETPFEALGIDSLGMAELLFNLEDEFAIKLPGEPVPLPTIGDAVRYIEDLVAAQHPADADADDRPPGDGPSSDRVDGVRDDGHPHDGGDSNRPPPG